MITRKYLTNGFSPEVIEVSDQSPKTTADPDRELEEQHLRHLEELKAHEREVEVEQRATLSSSTLDFHRQLAVAVLPEAASDVPRNLPCKEFAKVVRAFFKQIGLSGISVRTPNYSMAMGIEIRIPAREDYKRKSDGSFDWLNLEDCPASQSNGAAEKLLSKFMNRHFPNHGNYSDGQIDHFDFRWSIH